MILPLSSKIGLAKDSLKKNCGLPWSSRLESSLLLLTLSVWFSVCKAVVLENCFIGKDLQ